jgi:hypothetical protein
VLRKRITLLERRADLDRAAFSAHWSGPHVPIVLGLPGIARYLQHHVVEGADGLDGIVEITFDLPADAPAHRSAEQEEDELTFLGGLTGLAVGGTTVCDAPFAAWWVGAGDPPSLPAAAEPNRRDPAAPVMRRERLGSLQPAPDVVVGWPARDEQEARDLAACLAAGSGRVTVTRTVHIR